MTRFFVCFHFKSNFDCIIRLPQYSSFTLESLLSSIPKPKNI
jgi:hypothetical protein